MESLVFTPAVGLPERTHCSWAPPPGWRPAQLAVTAPADSERSRAADPVSLACLASTGILGATRLVNLRTRAGRHSRRRWQGPSSCLRASSNAVVRNLLGEKPDEPEVDEDWVEYKKRREQQERELKELEEELNSKRKETEEEYRFQGLEARQNQLREVVKLRRIKKKVLKGGRHPNLNLDLASHQPATGTADASAAVEAGKPRDPPSPWRLVCHTSGRWYYWDTQSGLTSWEPPVSPEPRPEDPPEPWESVLDTESGRWYYHNTESGVTSWEVPAPVVPDPPTPDLGPVLQQESPRSPRSQASNGAEAALDAATINSMSVNDLKAALRARKSPVSGRKAVLQARLAQACGIA